MLIKFKYFLVMAITFLLILSQVNFLRPVSASTVEPVQKSILPGNVSLDSDSYLHQKILSCIDNDLNYKNLSQLTELYRTQPETGFTWAGDFWPKWAGTVAQAWEYLKYIPGNETRAGTLKTRLDNSFNLLKGYQGSDGYLGCRTESNRLQGWDLWERKQMIKGLVDCYNIYKYEGDPNYQDLLDAAKKQADLLVAKIGTNVGQIDIYTAQSDFSGLAGATTLEPMVDLYNATSDTSYLDFTNYIVNHYGNNGIPDIINNALSGKHAYECGTDKAYELTANYVGLLAKYLQCGDVNLKNAAINYADNLMLNQINIARERLR